MNGPPDPSRGERALVDAEREFRVALISLFVGPLVMTVVGVLLAAAVIFLPSQPAFVSGLGLALIAGACAGIPGIRAGRRALAATEWVQSASDSAELEIGGRARTSAIRARGLGVAASVVGIVLAPLVAMALLLMGAGAPGRPFRKRGRIQMPDTRHDGSWCTRTPVVPTLTERERQRRAQRWLADARSEHASIASFCRVALDLLALGAPPSLVEQALKAAQDEVVHARLAYELASAFAGEPLSAGALRAAADGDGPSRLRLAASSFADGWLNEGMAANRAREGAIAADNQSERAALTRIAVDEARHAKLGRELATWAIHSSVTTHAAA